MFSGPSRAALRRDGKLHYNYFRDYDPGTGRYIESDPIGLAGGSSTYGYVGSKPLTAIDPFGLSDLIYFKQGTQSYDFASRVRSPRGVIVVAAHCNPQLCIDAEGHRVSPHEMAVAIKSLPRWKEGMTTRLDGCNAGTDPEDGSDPYAKQLAIELESDTLGPNDFIFQNRIVKPLIARPMNAEITWRNWEPGSFIGGPNTRQPGRYIHFGPKP